MDTSEPGGPWGDVMDVFFCLLPILFLVITVTVTHHGKPLMPTTMSLPIAAVLMYIIRLAYLGSDPLLATASVGLGLLEVLTPLSIVAGASVLFETMEATLCLPFMVREIESLTGGHPIAELMLIFSFAYMVEGASGFGTPAALSVPMLVRRGYPAVESIAVVLIFNSFSPVWGTAGTPLWFGFGSVLHDMPQDEADELLLDISIKAALALAVSAIILMPFALTILVTWKDVRNNMVFVYAALICTVGPSVGIAAKNYEFPSLLGGIVGCLLSAVLISFRIGLKPIEVDRLFEASNQPSTRVASSDHDDDWFASDSEIEEGVTDSSNNNDASDANKQSGKLRQLSSGETKPNLNHSESMRNESETPLQVENGSDDVKCEKKTSNSDSNNNDDDLNTSVQSITCRKTKQQLVRKQSRKPEQEMLETLGPRKTWKEGYAKDALLRTFPIWGVVVLLALTRVEEIGIKKQLTSQEPNFSIHFGTLGTFRLSSTLVFQMRDILTYPNMNWKYELLYVPFLVPFMLISLWTMVLFRRDMTCKPRDIVSTVLNRLRKPAVAVVGALVLVQLMIRVGTVSPAFILGTVLADWFQEAFVIICPLLGALGAFFSGSTTVSNLTFGEIQVIAAEAIGTSISTMLALQTVGASAANSICLNNIIAASAVVGLAINEGELLLHTYKYVFSTTTIATAVMLVLIFRF